jgi:DNA polymerase-1
VDFNFPNLYGRVVAGDAEATGLEWWKGDHMFGIGIAYREHPDSAGRPGSGCKTFYFDVRHPQVRSWMETAFCDIKLWVNQYIKYDCHMMREAGFRYPRNRISCTMVREAIIDENKYEYGLDVLGHKYLGRGKEDIWPELARMFGGPATKTAQIKNLQNAPEGLVAKYAKEDALLALLIHEAQDKIIAEEKLQQVYDLEMRLLAVLVDMERDGVRVDLDRAQVAHKDLNKKVWEEQRRLNRMVGKEVNVNSPVQTKQILGVHRREDGYWYTGDGLKLESNPPSKTEITKALAEGRPAVGSPSLDSVKMQQCKIPEAQMIVDIRGLIKARDTFIEQYMLNMSHGGYIHASFNQTRTEDGNGIYTGRISISDPALQQIHKRNKVMAAIVRACFIPDDGLVWSCHDWSQMDFRLFAHFLNDLRINALYAQDRKTDFHKLTANLTGLPRDRDQKTGGANAKQINLACVFGMGAGELAKQCSLPYTVSTKGYLVAGPEAKAMFGKYHSNIPGVRKLQNSVESVAKSRGFIRTQLGRRIRFPQGHGSHKAAGLLYQATAADAMKMKAVEVYNFLQDRQYDYAGRLQLLVHDEFDCNLTPDFINSPGLADMTQLLERFDGEQTPMKFRIPIVADHGHGPNWWEASK